MISRVPKRVARAVRRRIRGGSGALALRWPAGEAPAGMRALFIGGTGRSGTTVMGRLLGSHPDFAELPSETKFLTGPEGLCALVGGAVSYEQFEAYVRGQAFENRFGRGLHMMAGSGSLDALLPRLRAGLDKDPWAAAAAFVHDLLDPVALAAGKKGWVDTTPSNGVYGVALSRMFPNMRLVHMVRDGRDVAVSVTKRRWGPDDIDDALDWWARRLERAFAACERLPAPYLLTLQMEDLFVRDREPSFERLLAFVGLSEDPAIRRYFDEETPAGKAHAGRWRRDVPADRVAAFEAHHARAAREFARRGRPYEPFVLAKAPELAAVG